MPWVFELVCITVYIYTALYPDWSLASLFELMYLLLGGLSSVLDLVNELFYRVIRVWQTYEGSLLFDPPITNLINRLMKFGVLPR